MSEIALSAAVSAMNSSMENIRVRVNNIANVNSLGYKTMQVETKDIFYNIVTKPGGSEGDNASTKPVGVQVGIGSKVTGTYRNMSLGDIKQTARPLDIAILGAGYIAVILPNGNKAYTKAGALQLDNEKRIVTSDGYLIDPAIDLSGYVESSVKINTDGKILAQPEGGGALEEVGNILLFRFANENGLEMIGNSYLIETQASGEAIETIPGTEGAGTIRNGMLEISNVDISEEYAAFMAAQQAYHMGSRMMNAISETLKDANK